MLHRQACCYWLLEYQGRKKSGSDAMRNVWRRGGRGTPVRAEFMPLSLGQIHELLSSEPVDGGGRRSQRGVRLVIHSAKCSYVKQLVGYVDIDRHIVLGGRPLYKGIGPNPKEGEPPSAGEGHDSLLIDDSLRAIGEAKVRISLLSKSEIGRVRMKRGESLGGHVLTLSRLLRRHIVRILPYHRPPLVERNCIPQMHGFSGSQGG